MCAIQIHHISFAFKCGSLEHLQPKNVKECTKGLKDTGYKSNKEDPEEQFGFNIFEKKQTFYNANKKYSTSGQGVHPKNILQNKEEKEQT